MSKKKQPGYEQMKCQIDTVLACADGDQTNICYALYKVIRSAPESIQPRLLQYTAEAHDEAESNKEVRISAFLSKNEEEELRERFGDVSDEMLLCLIKENPSPADFYKKLWAVIQNPLFRSEKAKAFVFYNFMIDRRLPYFQIEQGLRVSAEDWRSTARKLRKSRAELRFLLARPFEQRSEEADLIIKVLDKHKDIEKAALMGYILWELRHQEAIRSLVNEV